MQPLASAGIAAAATPSVNAHPNNKVFMAPLRRGPAFARHVVTRPHKARGGGSLRSTASRIPRRVSGESALAEAALERVGEIRALPGEAAVLFGRATEMPVGRGAPIDRPIELQCAPDIGRP